MCRFLKASVLSPVTGGRIVTPIDFGKDQIPRYNFETSPIPEPPPFQHKTYSTPVPNIDCRAISFEIRRRSLRLQNDLGNFSADFDLIDCLQSPLLQHMAPSYKDKILMMSPPDRETVRRAIIEHNKWVTEYVPGAMACLSCNTAGISLHPNYYVLKCLLILSFFAVYPMGVGTSSKSIFVYCCLYLVKVVFILESASIICTLIPTTSFPEQCSCAFNHISPL